MAKNTTTKESNEMFGYINSTCHEQEPQSSNGKRHLHMISGDFQIAYYAQRRLGSTAYSVTEGRKEKKEQTQKKKKISTSSDSSAQRRRLDEVNMDQEARTLISLIEQTRQKMAQVKLGKPLSSRLAKEFHRIEKKCLTSEFYVTESERDLLIWAHDLLTRKIENIKQRTAVARAG